MRDMEADYGVTDTTIRAYALAAGVPRRSPWRPKRVRDRQTYLLSLKNKLGLPWPEFRALYRRQRGRCAICREKVRVRNNDARGTVHVDHDHKTGRVRGLLCAKCNQALGLFEDDAARLMTAVRYLRTKIPPSSI